LPAESETIRQFNQRLAVWLKNPQENADYGALRTELELWRANRKQLQPLLIQHPEWTSLADKVDAVTRSCLELLEARVKTAALAQSERKKVRELIQHARALDQELVVATVTSLEKILNSFTSS
jgi:hypothetical protein